MFDYEEIDRTVRDNKLPLHKIDGREKEELLQRLYDTFVIGNPRALWLSFKYVPEWIDCNMEDPYWHLLEVIDKDAILYLIVDYWNTDFVVFKGRMSDIHTFIGDCDGLDEFYLMTTGCQELYSITDHDDLLYIDVNKNKQKNAEAARPCGAYRGRTYATSRHSPGKYAGEPTSDEITGDE